MAIRRAVLVIADIGGYTDYMQWNRMQLGHAQQTVAELLEAIIDAREGLKLAKLEGDAAFFWAPEGTVDGLVCDGVSRMRDAFHARRERIRTDHPCDCPSCAQRANLSLKFVVHEGEVAEQKVKRHVELAGIDVILVHRMLKNDVPVAEYVLMTDAVAHRLDEALGRLANPLTHVYEGIGETSTHYIDLAAPELLPAAPERPARGRRWARAKFELNALPYMLGWKKSDADFSSRDRRGRSMPPV